MGLVLSDVFRMADAQYEGEINKEQFIKSMFRLRTQLDESLFNEMFYAIDTSLNGLISEDEFEEFSLAYGGGASAKKLRKFQKKVKSKLGGFIVGKYGTLEAFLK
jgi:Ca2+-binding EF-hand superfamily protein